MSLTLPSVQKRHFLWAVLILAGIFCVVCSQFGRFVLVVYSAVQLQTTSNGGFAYFRNSKISESDETAGGRGFQAVTVGEAYVYSAYLDGRPSPDVRIISSRPIVRIVSFFLRKMAIVDRYSCLFSYDGIQLVIRSRVISVTDLNAFDRRKKYKVGLFNCQLPMVPDGVPVKVSVVDINSTSAFNVLDIIDLKARMERFQRSSSVVNFTICTSPLHSSQINASDLIAFIEINRLFGAQKFIFYLESVSEDVKSCLASYEKRGIVELNHWNLPEAGRSLHYHGQIIAISECLYRTMYLTKYMISQDLDELVVPMRSPDWSRMLESVHSRNKTPPVENTAAYIVRNMFFPVTSPDDKEVKDDSLIQRYGIKALQKTANVGYANAPGTRSKSIGRPERLLMWHVHVVLRSSLVRKKDQIVVVNVEDGLLFHYRVNWTTASRGKKRIRRMHNFTSEIIQRISLARRSCSLPQ